jgi:hypothetical protein
MAELAAHLVDAVLPHVAVRQWVLTLPHRLRYLLAYNHALCRAVLAVHVRAVLGFYRRRARREVRDGRGGAVPVIPRFGGGLQLNVHFHSLFLDGVFAAGADGTLEFHPADPPSDEDVARLLATIRRRVLRLLARRGLAAEGAPGVDPLAEESAALAGISSAAVQGRVALGPRAGARVLQLGREPDAPWVTSRGPRQAHLHGFDLHADITVGADDRTGLERLARYVLRPPVAQDRLALTPDGQVLLSLKSEWADGTTHLLFEPLEFLEKLAALTPRPWINLLLYHGILAPHARGRAQAITRRPPPSTGERPPASEEPGADTPARPPEPGTVAPPEAPPDESPPRATEKPRDWAWADLMRRVFDVDVLACPRCGGRMAVIATIEAGDVVRKILHHLGLPAEPPSPLPARPPPLASGLFPDFPA